MLLNCDGVDDIVQHGVNELLCSSWNDSFDASAIGCSDLSLS